MHNKQFVLVTNNPKAEEKYRNHPDIAVEFLSEGTFLDVLLHVRDLVHRGHSLMSHPLASNLKPGQSPYKTILLSRNLQALDFVYDIELVESSLDAYRKFTGGMSPPRWDKKSLRDFMTIDLSVVDSAISSSLFRQLMGGYG